MGHRGHRELRDARRRAHADLDQMSQEHIDYMLSKIPLNRFLEPEEAAALIAWLASEECAFSTGAVFDIRAAARPIEAVGRHNLVCQIA